MSGLGHSHVDISSLPVGHAVVVAAVALTRTGVSLPRNRTFLPDQISFRTLGKNSWTKTKTNVPDFLPQQLGKNTQPFIQAGAGFFTNFLYVSQRFWRHQLIICSKKIGLNMKCAKFCIWICNFMACNKCVFEFGGGQKSETFPKKVSLNLETGLFSDENPEIIELRLHCLKYY